MRKITKDAIEAFYSNKRFKKANTSVEIDYERDQVILKLHGNKIAFKDTHGDLWIDTCNWDTITTRERLNGFEEVHLKKVKGNLILNNQPWNGKLIKIY